MTALWDCVVVGGGPAGATAAHDLAQAGYRVALLDKAGRIKPCGGAVPPRLLRDFSVPEDLLVARAATARITAPSQRAVTMTIDRRGRGGFVGMVDREQFDAWLRARATHAGAVPLTGRCDTVIDDIAGVASVVCADRVLRTRAVIGSDGAHSRVARAVLPEARHAAHVFAYHEVIATPAGLDPACCEVIYDAAVSPDFYGWVFPHGKATSVGTGSAQKGFGLRDSVERLRARGGLDACVTLRREGAPIPLAPLPRWDNGRNCVVAGDAAGAVAPASGEGIYYAMQSGREAAFAVAAFLDSGNPRALRLARKRFMRAHGQVFWILGIMQRFWYGNDRRRERFVAMCADRDVQDMIWPAYMNKQLVYANPLACMRVFAKDMRHLIETSELFA